MEERTKIVPEQYAIDVLADHASHTLHIMLAVIIIMAVLLIACIGVIVWQVEKRVAVEHEYESFETYEYDIEQNADNNSNNYLAGRDLIYGGDATGQGEGD